MATAHARLLLVHGFTGARTDFESHFQSLARDRRVVAADHRGHGGSTNTGRAEDYTLDALFVSTSERLAGGIPDARLEVVEGAYHSPQHTHPEEWLARVRGHLEWVDAAG